MYCTHCGSSVPDGAAFCGKCGNKLKEQTPPAPAPASREPDSWDSYFLQRWKTFLSSPLILILLVCVTLTQILGAAADPMSVAFQLMDSLGIPDAYYINELNDVSNFLDSVRLLTMLPGILVVISLWMLFWNGRKGGPRLSTAGLTIIQVVQVVLLVLLCLAFGILIVGLFMLNGTGDSSYYDPNFEALLTATTITSVVAGILSVVIYSKILTAVKTAKHSLRDLVPAHDGARFVGVACIIGGVVTALMVLPTISYGINLSLVLNAASCFLYGGAAFSYRTLMEELIAVHNRIAQS